MLKEISFKEVITFYKRNFKIIIYGAGKDGATVAEELYNKNTEFCFCDTNRRGEYCGNVIIPPNAIRGMAGCVVLISSRKYDKEIYINLLEMGIKGEMVFSMSEALDKLDYVSSSDIFTRLDDAIYEEVRHFEDNEPEKFIINGLEIYMHKAGINAINFSCMYNRFQSYLAEIVEDGYIVDVGANVGDTAAWMIPYTKGNMLCIEPVQEYYKLLEFNISRFPSEYRNRIITRNILISDDVEREYVLSVDNGTATMKEVRYVSEKVNAKKLCDVLDDERINLQAIQLIKTDTDGNDFRCIMSMEEKLKYISPIIYFENGIENKETFIGFSRFEDYLKNSGYVNFWFFDNFGNYICYGDIETYHDINQYSMRMKKYDTGRTFFYTDIMACKDDKKDVCKKMIEKYLRNYKN